MKPDASFTVYVLVNDSAKLFYVGQTMNLECRLQQHRKKGRQTRGQVFHDALQAHGLDSFTVEVLAVVSERSTARRLEAEAIERMSSQGTHMSLNDIRPKRLRPQGFYVKPRRFKLGPQHVDEIRRLIAESGLDQRAIAVRFGVTQTMVSRIKNGLHSQISA